MKAKLLLSSLVSFAVALFGAGSAQANMIAGWDFSQYAFEGFLSIDGSLDEVFTLDSNYSDFVPDTPGSAASPFGTMYIDGQFGSTNTLLTGDVFVPSPSATAQGNLVSNQGAPAGVDFSSQVLAGQTFINPFTMTTQAPFVVVFEADLMGVPEQGTNWSISLGGKTNTGSSLVAIEFSNTGADGSFVSFGNVNFTAVDTPFTVNLGAAQSDKAYVRLSFNGTPGVAPFLDNLAFNATLVPEPATAALMLVGLAGLALAGRRRA